MKGLHVKINNMKFEIYCPVCQELLTECEC
jgi:hypothetical protein